MAQFKDLTGRRFGRLTVLEFARREQYFNRRGERGQDKLYWLCRCDCGREKEVLSANLTRGFTLSCGCYNKEVVSAVSTGRTNKRRRKIHDISIGSSFGDWTVISYLGSKTRSTSVADYYRCRCKCGKEKEHAGHHLLSGVTLKCRSCSGRETGIALTKVNALQGVLFAPKPVLCLESGEVFESVQAAANTYSVNDAALSTAIAKGKQIKGVTFVYLDEHPTSHPPLSPNPFELEQD